MLHQLTNLKSILKNICIVLKNSVVLSICFVITTLKSCNNFVFTFGSIAKAYLSGDTSIKLK